MLALTSQSLQPVLHNGRYSLTLDLPGDGQGLPQILDGLFDLPHGRLSQAQQFIASVKLPALELLVSGVRMIPDVRRGLCLRFEVGPHAPEGLHPQGGLGLPRIDPFHDELHGCGVDLEQAHSQVLTRVPELHHQVPAPGPPEQRHPEDGVFCNLRHGESDLLSIWVLGVRS